MILELLGDTIIFDALGIWWDAIGIKTFWQDPTVIGDWIITGDEPCPVGEEKAGVAERELPNDTEKENSNE